MLVAQIIEARANMNRGEKPQENWTLHNVRVDAYCSTLKGARLKAENPEYISSGCECVKGRGLRKNVKKIFSETEYSSDCDSEVTPPPTPALKNSSKQNSTQEVIVVEVLQDLPHNQGSHNQTRQPAKDVVSVQAQDAKANAWEQATLDSILEGSHSQTCQSAKEDDISVQAQDTKASAWEQATLESISEGAVTDAPCTNCKSHGNILKDIFVKVTKLERVMENISKSLSCLKMEQNMQHFDNRRLELIENLPLKTKADIDNFDKKIAEDNMKETYANYIKGIGGKDVRDFVNRSLNSLFTNELGKQCSLVGQRGNLRLDGYEFMKILQDIVLMTKGSSSRYEIEKAIGEWFRLSNQRMVRIKSRQQQGDRN